jgi:hypothetical protein
MVLRTYQIFESLVNIIQKRKTLDLPSVPLVEYSFNSNFKEER